MKDFTTRIFAAELRSDLPLLDVHGRLPDDVDTLIDQFLYTNRNESSLQIIHGHGKGILKQKVLDICRVHPLVEALVEKDGYVIILL